MKVKVSEKWDLKRWRQISPAQRDKIAYLCRANLRQGQDKERIEPQIRNVSHTFLWAQDRNEFKSNSSQLVWNKGGQRHLASAILNANLFLFFFFLYPAWLNSSNRIWRQGYWFLIRLSDNMKQFPAAYCQQENMNLCGKRGRTGKAGGLWLSELLLSFASD